MKEDMKAVEVKKRAFQVFAKNLKSLSFYQYILDFEKGRCYNDPGCFGKLNKGKTIYYISPCIKGGGFFANYRYLLMALIFADRCGYIPVIDFRKNFEYQEKEPVRGTLNPYEYYFNQPSDITVKEVMKSNSVVLYHKMHCEMIELLLNGSLEFYHINEDFINAAAYVQKKYITLQKNTAAYMKSSISDLIGVKRTLGVHVRGSDFKRNFNGHPIRVETLNYISKVEQIKKAHQFEQIFLATDDMEVIKQFEGKFGDCLVYYNDVIRTDKKISVMRSRVSRKYHHYKLGLEVLRDVYTLAACKGLVAGISQVIMGTRVIKRSLDQEFEVLEILDGGINHNRRYFK